MLAKNVSADCALSPHLLEISDSTCLALAPQMAARLSGLDVLLEIVSFVIGRAESCLEG